MGGTAAKGYLIRSATWSATTASVVTIAHALATNQGLGLRLLVGYFALAFLGGVLALMVVGPLFRLDRRRLPAVIAKAAIILGGLACVLLSLYFGAATLPVVGGLALGALLGPAVMASRGPSASAVSAARAAYKRAAARLAARTGEDETAELEQELKNHLLDCEVAVGSENPTTARFLCLLAEFYLREREWSAARALLARALRVFERRRTTQEQARVYHNLAYLSLQCEQYDEGLELCEKALTLSSDQHETALMEFTAARLLFAQDDYEKAARRAEASLGRLQREVGGGDSQSIEVALLWADCCEKTGHKHKSRELILQIIDSRRQVGRPEDAQWVSLWARLARLEEKPGRALREAVEALKWWGGSAHPDARELALMGQALVPAESRELWPDVLRGEPTARRVFVDHPEILEQRDEGGWTPIHWAVFWGLDGPLQSVEMTPERVGGEVPATLVAARWGRRSLMTGLLDHCSAEATDPQGRGLVHMAAMAGDSMTLSMLTKLKPDWSAADKQGQTPLHLAARGGHCDAMLELLQHRVPIDALDLQGRTPLFLAVEGGVASAVELLLLNGARPTQGKGKTPLARARELGRQDLLDLMARHGGAR
ncbi:MAG: ankyrin repeat domain-containing protein [Vulcanimicrobiota bacterium]